MRVAPMAVVNINHLPRRCHGQAAAGGEGSVLEMFYKTSSKQDRNGITSVDGLKAQQGSIVFSDKLCRSSDLFLTLYGFWG